MLLGDVGVARERDRRARLERAGEERRRRVDLRDRLAQARGGNLDRDAGLRDRLERGLVVAAHVAVRDRVGLSPTSSRGRGARGRRTGRCGQPQRASRNSAATPPPGCERSPRCRSAPSRPRDRRGSAPSRPRNRASQCSIRFCVVLATRHEVHLQPRAAGRSPAHERAVRVDVVERLLAPERVIPDGERLLEAWMCSETPSSEIPASAAAHGSADVGCVNALRAKAAIARVVGRRWT